MQRRRELFILIFIVLLLFQGNRMVTADSNMDGGGSGGGTQGGTSDNYYSSGDDGVRITVINIKTGIRANGTWTIDYFRKSKENKAIVHFGKYSKLEYMGVAGYSSSKALQQSSEGYRVDSGGKTVAYQVEEMPTIVSSSLGNSDIDEIKDYFDDKARLEVIASRVGMSYEEMTNGNYKLIIEPVIYFTFEGKYMAMTAHEAALLDLALGGTATTGGQLRAKFVSFTHKNLPLSIFLKKKELGVNRWTGSKTDRVQNGQILKYLGIGILSFEPDTEVQVGGGSYWYRPNTDVITAVNVSVDGAGDGATCDNPITVQFSGAMIPTITISGIVIPPGGSRPVWIKWRTPDLKLQTSSTIHVSITGGSSAVSASDLDIVIKPLVEQEPPNPTADDTKPKNFDDTLPAFPKMWELRNYTSPITTTSWHTYTCTKSSVWTGGYETDAYGNYVHDYYGNKIKIYETVYTFTTNNYSASLTLQNALIVTDTAVKEANPSSGTIKSGYGIELRVNTKITGNADVTGMQNAAFYFPEFNYKTWRRLGKLPGASLNDTIQFPVNLYSINKSRIHFLPIWFPDKTYTVYVETLDAWTPGGMLSYYTTASINVQGSMWDNWHISILPNY